MENNFHRIKSASDNLHDKYNRMEKSVSRFCLMGCALLLLITALTRLKISTAILVIALGIAICLIGVVRFCKKNIFTYEVFSATPSEEIQVTDMVAVSTDLYTKLEAKSLARELFREIDACMEFAEYEGFVVRERGGWVLEEDTSEISVSKKKLTSRKQACYIFMPVLSA